MARGSFAGHARPIAVAVGWLLLFGTIGIGIAIGLSELLPGFGGREWSVTRLGVYQSIGFLVATWVVGVVLDQQSWDRMGWHPRGVWMRHLLRGVALGAVMAAVAVGLALAVNRASVRLTPDWSRWPATALPVLIGLLGAALSEELALRGYPLRRLADATGPWVATILLAVLFSALHFGNADISLVGKFNIFLAGLWLSVAFFSPGGMGLAWGLHFGWNAGLALVFDAPVSGISFYVPAVQYVPGVHSWVDGGGFGPEGGVVGTIVFLAGTLALIGARLRRPKAWLA